MNSADVCVDDVMAIVHYFKVNSVYNRGNDLRVTDLHNKGDFEIHGRSLVETAFSADRYETEKKTTKTKIAEALVNAGHKPFTVHFVKQNGKERTMRAKMIAPEPMMGRSRVEDFDDKALKQVDHRTIQWLILDNVKYMVK